MNKLVIVCLALVALQFARIEASNRLGFWEYVKESELDQLSFNEGKFLIFNF